MKNYLLLLRPQQLLKNLIIFFPPFLGGKIVGFHVLAVGILPLLSFSLISCSSYIFNDLLDFERDRLHPRKKERPLASGAVSRNGAIGLMIFLLVGGLYYGFSVSPEFGFVVLAYLLLTTAYSAGLKNIVVVDLFCISIGFLLRLEAGGVAFSVRISEWLFLSVFLLSLYLAAGKRLSEKNCLEESAEAHRRTLGAYPPGFLEGSLYLSGAAVLVTYAMYVVDRPTLIYTVPLCCFGLLRYLLNVLAGRDGDPTSSLLKDLPLLAVSVIWAIMVGWSIYR